MTDVETQLNTGPEFVEGLLANAKRPLSLSDPLFWHGLAEGAAQHANWALDAGQTPLALTWARCAIRIYETLAADVREPNSFELSAMHVRVRVIRFYGAQGGDLVRDPSVLFDWVRAVLVGRPEEAAAESGRVLKGLAEAQNGLQAARSLREMKNRLSVLGPLADELPLDLRAWLAVRDRLV